MTVDEIVAAQDALMQGAESRGGLSDEECTRYEELETELVAARRRTEIETRHQAIRVPATPALVTAGATPSEDERAERFSAWLRAGAKVGPEQDAMAAQRAQQEVTGPAGGYLVPDLFRAEIVRRLKDFGGVSEAARTVTTSGGEPMYWPTVDDTANMGEIVQEGDTFSSGADVVFGRASLGAFKYMAGGAANTGIRVSWELLQDSAINLPELLGDLLGERIARLQAVHLATGTGQGQPQGILDGLTVAGGTATEAVSATLAYADLLKYVHAVDPAYRRNAVWIFNDATLAAIRGLLGTDGRPLLQPASSASAAGAPGGETLLGYPVYIDQAMPNRNGASDTTVFGVFGDVREGYVVRRVRDIALVANPWVRANYAETEFFAWARMDAVIRNPNAYTGLAGFTS